MDIALVKSSLISFAKDKVTRFSPLCDSLVVDFDTTTHEIFSKDLLNFYIGGTADAKNKWILYYTSIYGGSQMIELFTKTIKFFTDNTRGAMAKETVRALSLNKSPQTLSIIEEMSRKSKNKTVKKYARESLDFVADELNISHQELGDRIIPNFGFDKEMKLVVDYGTRKFDVFLNTKLDLEVVEQNTSKVMKNLPKILASDNQEIDTKSSEEFKGLKKSLKATIKTQTERLELAMSISRAWTYEKFIDLYVKNPIMYKFATTLIFGIYVDGKLTETFRYMDDGTYNSVDEEEITLNQESIIGIVHKTELDDELLSNWKEQLEDYEITQIINQLERTIFEVDNKYLEINVINFDENINYSGTSLKSKLTKIGFIPIKDETEYAITSFEHHELVNNISAVFSITGISTDYYEDYDSTTNLIKLEFFDLNEDLINIENVPKKIISEIFNVLSMVVIDDDDE